MTKNRVRRLYCLCTTRTFLNPATDFSATGYIEVRCVNKHALSEGINDIFIVMVSRMGMTRLDNHIGRRYEQYVSGTPLNSSE